MQKSWGVQRVCVSSKFAATADAAVALRPISLRALENMAESDVGGSWRRRGRVKADLQTSQLCLTQPPDPEKLGAPQLLANHSWMMQQFS